MCACLEDEIRNYVPVLLVPLMMNLGQTCMLLHPPPERHGLELERQMSDRGSFEAIMARARR